MALIVSESAPCSGSRTADLERNEFDPRRRKRNEILVVASDVYVVEDPEVGELVGMHTEIDPVGQSILDELIEKIGSERGSQSSCSSGCRYPRGLGQIPIELDTILRAGGLKIDDWS